MISRKPIRALIEELNQTDETEALEAKLSSEVGKSLLETVCSMSNEPGLGGGTILLGLSKDDNSLFPFFALEGIENPDKLCSDIASQCTVMFNIAVRPDVTVEVIGRRVVVRIDVDELSPSQKPLYFKSLGLPRGAYRRIGSTDQRCTDDDLQVFYLSRTTEAADEHVVEGAAWDDVDPEAVSAYRRARAALNPLAEELNWSDEELLQALNCVVWRNNSIHITRAGLVSFGKASALRRLDPSNRVDYIRVPGKQWVANPDSTLESIDMRGSTLRTAG